MVPDRTTRWGDSRLDDLANELRALRNVPAELAEMKVEIRNLRRDVDHCAADVKDHRADFQAYVEEQDKAHENHRLERKSDRRWMIGTALTAAGLVIAAVSILAGQFG